MTGTEGLTPPVREWVARSAGAAIREACALAGATSSAVYGVTVGNGTELVLRLYDNAEWVAQEPDLARHEAAALEWAARADVPTPELMACDATGAQCGLPAVLMTRLPGDVVLMPDRLDDWLWRMAEALLPIHALDADTFPWRYGRYNARLTLTPPDWSEVPDLWARLIAAVQDAPPGGRECFIHRDYHPNNVLWETGRVSGIVDWVSACRGAPGLDVAWCRQNLAQLHGVPAADGFLDAYQSLAGPSFSYHPYWDLMGLAEFLPGPPDVYPGWPACGVRHLTDSLVRHRLEAYLASVLARF